MIEERRNLFSIKINPEAFVKRRLVSGPIWMEAGGESFPGTGWIDFPVVILGFWVTNVQPVAERRLKKCTLPFMDGPYSGVVEVSSTYEWTLMFLERAPQGENVLFTTKIDAGMFLDQILGAAKTVVEFCKKKQWVDDDLLSLESSLLQLKQHRKE